MRTYQTVLLGSTASLAPGTYPAQSLIGSSAIGTTNVNIGTSSANFFLPTTASQCRQNIEFSNGFALQLNVGLATTAAASGPSGTVTVQCSTDGINFTTLPVPNGGFAGTTAITFSSSGVFAMLNYPQPNFNWIRGTYSAGSTSAISVYQLVMNSKNFGI